MSNIGEGQVGIRNVAEEQINPATQETLATIASQTQNPTDLEGNGLVAIGTTATIIAFTGTTREIIISAATSNTGTLYIGKSNVTSAGVGAIVALEAGESVQMGYNDVTNGLYVVASIASQNYISGALI